MKRTILVAYSANLRENSSVPIIGFKLAQSLAAITDATLIFHAADRDDMEGVYPSDRVHFAGSGVLFRTLRRLSTRFFADRWNLIWLIEFFDYLLFDLHASVIARRIVRRGPIDYALRINPVSLQLPSALARLPIPVFTGPHNGGIEWPAGFAFLDAEEVTASRLRVLGTILHTVYGDFSRYAGIFVANSQCAGAVPPQYGDRVMLLSENGVDGVAAPSGHAGDATRLLFVGRLVPFKGLRFVLRALSRLPDNVRLTVVGAGVERNTLAQMAEGLGISGRCQFLGMVEHRRLDEIYGEAGVFVFPSLRETGGAVVLEAMSHGLPCIVADWGGPVEYVGDAGIRLAVGSQLELEDGLLRALESLLEDPARGRELGRVARERIVEEYVWARKAERLAEMALERIASL